MNFKNEKYKSGPYTSENREVKTFSQEGSVNDTVESVEVFLRRLINFAKNKFDRLLMAEKNKIRRIEESVNLSNEDLSLVRQEMNLDSRLNGIRNRIEDLYDRCVGILITLLNREINSNISNKELELKKENSKYKEFFINFNEEDRICVPLIKEAISMRNELLEGRGFFTLSKNEFDRYFLSKDFEINGVDLRQGNVGNCYLIAAIHAMSRSPFFEIICRSSMKRLPDGTWEVRMPLMSRNGKIIRVRQEDLLPQKNNRFLKRKKYKDSFDFRINLNPVSGKEGLRVLEAAFTIYKFYGNRLDSEGGFSSAALLSLLGDNFFIKFDVRGEFYDEDTGRFHVFGLNSLDDARLAQLDFFLENFDPNIYIAVVSSRYRTILAPGNIGIGAHYKIKGIDKVFVFGHAYSISGIDSKNRIVTVVNPWNTSEPFNLTFDEFKQVFNSLSVVRVNFANLLSNMKSVSEKENII